MIPSTQAHFVTEEFWERRRQAGLLDSHLREDRLRRAEPPAPRAPRMRVATGAGVSWKRS
ncbi:MAG: hypothetical protein F4X12_21535 [Acidobacteriia bacterium]|nr:hypothetical protein [Terriglobia bacterium]